MTRRDAITRAGLLGLFLAGCCSTQPASPYDAALIFDASRGHLDAGEFIWRPPTAAATGFSDERESVRFREYIFDHQGEHFYGHDHYSRRVVSVRQAKTFR